jgi:hypothetical protein
MWFALQDLLGPTSRIPGWVKMSSRGLEGDCNFAEVSVRYQTDVCEELPSGICVSCSNSPLTLEASAMSAQVSIFPAHLYLILSASCKGYGQP